MDYTKNFKAFVEDYFKTEPLSKERRLLVDGLMDKIEVLTDEERDIFSRLMEEQNRPFKEKIIKQLDEMEKKEV